MGVKVKAMNLGLTPLSLATEHGHTVLVKLFLETEQANALYTEYALHKNHGSRDCTETGDVECT